MVAVVKVYREWLREGGECLEVVAVAREGGSG